MLTYALVFPGVFVTLQRSNGLDETGSIVWHLAFCLLLSAELVYASLSKGIKSSGKVSQHQSTCVTCCDQLKLNKLNML